MDLDDATHDPHMPRLVATDDGFAPAAPMELGDAGVDAPVLSDLLLKAAFTVPQFTTEWAARRVHVPQVLVGEMLEDLRFAHLLDILGEAGPFGYRYAISGRGRERAERLMEISGYVGPAPVSLASYTALLAWQMGRLPTVGPERVRSAVAELVLPDRVVEAAGLAVSSGRSLFLHGPPGNGKTALGRVLNEALEGDLWIPHCIGVDDAIIRVFDPQCHEVSDGTTSPPGVVDRRWIRVRRPHVVVGGEMTLDSCDLAFRPSLRYYEAPLHLKANGGTLLIDDFGRQRVDPIDLLNRWIIPLEHRIDYLTLKTGQKIQVPFEPMLIIATNLEPGEVTDPAFLRRMGYRAYLGPPTPGLYARIFAEYAGRHGAEVPAGLIERLLRRYESTGRELRSCEPRDLIERARDICDYRGRPLALDDELLDLAWAGYFGEASPGT